MNFIVFTEQFRFEFWNIFIIVKVTFAKFRLFKYKLICLFFQTHHPRLSGVLHPLLQPVQQYTPAQGRNLVL